MIPGIPGLTSATSAAFPEGFENAKAKIRALYRDFDEVVTLQTRSYTEGDIEHDIISFWKKLSLTSSRPHAELETLLIEFIATNLLIRLYKGEDRLSVEDLLLGYSGFFKEIWRRLTSF